MAFKLFDWIKDTTVSTGTDDFELAGAFATFRSFDDVLVDGDTIHYTAYIDGHRESGLGTYDATAGVLVRTTVYDSTNGGAKVSFPAGTKIIECAPVASRMLTLDGPTKMRFLANKAGINQAIPDADTVITYGNEVYDWGGIYDHTTSTFTPPVGKAFVVHAQFVLGAASGGGLSSDRNAIVQILRNGSVYAAGGSLGGGNDISPASPQVTIPVIGDGAAYTVRVPRLIGTFQVRGGTADTFFWADES